MPYVPWTCHQCIDLASRPQARVARWTFFAVTRTSYCNCHTDSACCMPSCVSHFRSHKMQQERVKRLQQTCNAMTRYNFDDCYDKLDEYCTRSVADLLWEPAPLSLGMRKVIKDTAIVNAEDPYWDDGFYNQYIPHQIQGKCSTRDALKGLQTLFFNMVKHTAQRRILHRKGFCKWCMETVMKSGVYWTCKEILECWRNCRRCTGSCLSTGPDRRWRRFVRRE